MWFGVFKLLKNKWVRLALLLAVLVGAAFGVLQYFKLKK
jgi:hypothetical protein